MIHLIKLNLFGFYRIAWLMLAAVIIDACRHHHANEPERVWSHLLMEADSAVRPSMYLR